MKRLTGIVIDLAPHPAVEYRVIIKGELLPMRFAREIEASDHLAALHAAAERSPEKERAEVA